VAGFSRAHGDAHGFRVAHFAHNNNVRRLAQRGAQRGGKIRSVGADFHLLNHAAQIGMFILNRIFDGEDVAGLAAVDLMDQSGESGGLSRTRWSADQDQSARHPAQGLNLRGQMQFADRRDF